MVVEILTNTKETPTMPNISGVSWRAKRIPTRKLIPVPEKLSISPQPKPLAKRFSNDCIQYSLEK